MLKCAERLVLRRGWALLVVVFFAIASSSFAAEFDIEVGHWVGKSEWSSGGHFESCMVSEHNDKNEIFILKLDRKQVLTIGLFEKQWESVPQIPLELIVMIDHTVLHSGKGWLQAKDALFIRLKSVKASLSKFESGKFLQISAGDQSIVFNLKDSGKAVAFLRSCLRQGLRSHKNI